MHIAQEALGGSLVLDMSTHWAIYVSQYCTKMFAIAYFYNVASCHIFRWNINGTIQWCCVTELKVPSSGTSSNFDGTGTELVPFQIWWNLL